MKQKVRVACVGDSITYGAGSSDPMTRSYPTHLQLLLGETYLVGNFGVSGATTLKNGDKPYIKTDKYEPSLEFVPDVVIIMLGTNDSKPMNWEMYEQEYKSDATKLINTYKNLPSQPIIYMATSPTAWYNEGVLANSGTITPDTVQKIVELQKELINELNIHLIEVNDYTKDKKEYFPDGVHPNDEGFALIANFIYSKIKDN